MPYKQRWNYHNSALSFHATLDGSLERLKDSPTSVTDREIIDPNIKCTEPIEMLNDEKERHMYASMVSIMMAWIKVPLKTPMENDRLIMQGLSYRIRKVKAWPAVIRPAFYELHLEDES
jgi:hypothetical protein